MATSVAFGGIERVLLTMLEHMDREIELVPIVFTRTDTRENSFFAELRRMRLAHETLLVNVARPYLVANSLVNLRQAAAMFRKYRFDLVHSHGYRADMFALPLAKRFGLPLVSTCHGFIDNDRRLTFYNRLDARLLRAFTRVIAVSGPMKRDLVAAGVKGDRIDVVPNAVADIPDGERRRDRQQIRAAIGVSDETFVFGFVGRLSPEKGPDYLVRAIAALPAGRSVCALVIGDGPAKSELERLARESGVADRIRFAGFQTNAGPWFSACDAFVLPSLTEGTPMALLEALAHKLPVAATRVGGVPDVITHGINGLLVSPGDVAGLADAMRQLSENVARREMLAAAGLAMVRARFGVETWVRQTADVYRRSLPAEVVQ